MEVFLEEGYAGFSSRGVARRASISVGNLHYYFPSKESLLSKMFGNMVESYSEQLDALHVAGESPREQFVRLVSFLIHDLSSSRTSTFFPEIWALSNHDSAVAELMDEMYAWERAQIAVIVEQLAPGVDPGCREAIVLFISASIEGMTMFIGHGKSHTHLVDSMAEIAIASYLQMIDNACAESGRQA